ncbi:MAG TPA: ATP synthase F0 subunit B [Vicinamibacterales bacterium]
MLPGLAVIWVIVFVLLIAVVLDRGLFRPIGRVMREREAAIRTAQELAQESATRAREATAEFERRTKAAQADVYREMDENRRLANDQRAAIMAQTRQEVEASVADASARLQAQKLAASAQLEKEADALGEAIVERVLDRKAS